MDLNLVELGLKKKLITKKVMLLIHFIFYYIYLS